MAGLLDWLRVHLLPPALLAIVAVAQILRPLIGMDRVEAWARTALRRLRWDRG